MEERFQPDMSDPGHGFTYGDLEQLSQTFAVCEICWSLFPRDLVEKHQEWHDRIHSVVIFSDVLDERS